MEKEKRRKGDTVFSSLMTTVRSLLFLVPSALVRIDLTFPKISPRGRLVL